MSFPLILLLCLAGEAVRRFFHSSILWLFFPRTAVLWFLMCCALTAAAWYPSSHAARQLLEDDAFAATWYVFWILPILFISLNIFIMPRNPGILEQGRLRLLYIAFSFLFLALLLLAYLLFYLMASSLNRNARLRLENQFLSMQQTRYDSLLTTTRQIRQARHDLRHHFHVLQGFAAQGNMEGIGLQAVQHTAEKNGGYSQFHYGDGVFTANVMLRGGKQMGEFLWHQFKIATVPLDLLVRKWPV